MSLVPDGEPLVGGFGSIARARWFDRRKLLHFSSRAAPRFYRVTVYRVTVYRVTLYGVSVFRVSLHSATLNGVTVHRLTRKAIYRPYIFSTAIK